MRNDTPLDELDRLDAHLAGHAREQGEFQHDPNAIDDLPSETAEVAARVAQLVQGVSASSAVTPPEAQASWERFSARTMENRSRSRRLVPQALQGRTWPANSIVTRLMAAAAITGLAGMILLMRRSDTLAPSATRTYHTAPGQRASVTLAHGSRVILGPATTLLVAAHGSPIGTVVTVTGQALFTVAHRHQTPFTVRTGNTVTKVLGTTFLVRRYDTERITRVVVTEGRVSLQSLGGAFSNMAILTPRTLGMVSDSGQVRVTPTITVDDYTAWSTGRLVFHDTPVRDIVAELGRAYGVDIRLTDSALATRALTWTVPVTQKSLVDALEALTTVLDAHVLRSQGVVTIMPGTAVQSKPVNFPLSLPSITERQHGR